MTKTFKCNLPCKLSKDSTGKWIIEGQASTEDKDLQDEIVRQDGIDISPIKEGRGWLNYEHSNDAHDVVGKISDGWFNEKGLMIRGYLFQNHSKAKDVYGILSSLDEKDQKALSLSVEGKIKERTGKDNKIIKQAIIDRVAITTKPINQSTYISLVKSLSAINPTKDLIVKAILKKAMTVGYGGESAPTSRTGGNTMVPESLMGVKKKKKVKEIDPMSNIVSQNPILDKLWSTVKKSKKIR